MTTFIPGYRIKEKKFQSSNSILFSGYREHDHSPVIIKTLLAEYPNKRDIERLRHEYEVIKDIEIKGIVKPLDFINHNGQFFLILEDMGGQSLKSLLESRKFSLVEILNLGISLAETVEALHQNKIIHKDINPYHIIINRESGETKLTGFSISSSLPKEHPGILNPSFIEGTLAYTSPEQTGRMNRTLDYRTDFYSLGVTLYEMFTGRLPFESKYPLELVHSHMAKQPDPPHEKNPVVPKVISEIVLKLMAKTAEERYQSALGLKADLEVCIGQLYSHGKIEDFLIGRHDIPEKLQIAQGLYGREQEINLLIKSFKQVSQGEARLMLVSGYAGIGKTSLVKEINRSIVQKSGYFISGKFNQLQGNVPYSALISAFRDLVTEILSESKDKIEEWKEKLLASLGQNGQIIINVIPDIEKIIGPQPPAAELGPLEAQNRFNLTFSNFIQVFCRKEHPLVIFLDDLQWVDPDTLKLIELIVTDDDTEYLLLIGAFRDNEVDSTQPLMVTLERLSNRGAPISRIHVGPLKKEHITHLIADTIRTDSDEVRALADLVIQKTNGNPFFVSQFLAMLYQEGRITFDSKERKWKWEIAKLRTLDITDNVIELLINRLKQLSPRTRHVLSLAACIGNSFDIDTLSLLTHQKPLETYNNILPSIESGLIVSVPGYELDERNELFDFNKKEIFKFLHDRVQQATYTLLDDKDKIEAHLRIGRLLLHHIKSDEREERIFDILYHLNLSAHLLIDNKEKKQLAELNRLAGQKARSSAAFDVAFEHLNFGLSLLGVNCWEEEYELTLSLYSQTAETAGLLGNLKRMEELAEIVIGKARSTLDKVGVYHSLITGNYFRGRLSRAISAGLEILDSLGVKIPVHFGSSDIQLSIKDIQSRFPWSKIEEILEHPELTDPTKISILRILTALCLPAYLTQYELYVLLVLKGLDLTLHHGNSRFSPFFYCSYGNLLCGYLGDINKGYRLGKLALDLLDHLKEKEATVRTLEIFNIYIRHFKEHVRETIKPLEDAYLAGLETGEVFFAVSCATSKCIREYMVGEKLSVVEENMARSIHNIKKIYQSTLLPSLLPIYHQAVLNLLGESNDPSLLIGKVFDESSRLPHYKKINNRSALHYLYFNKLILACLFEQYDQALGFSKEAEKNITEVTGGLAVPVFHYYDSLVRLGVYDRMSGSEQKHNLERVVANQKKMKTWAKYAPMNHLHKFYLVEAEHSRVIGNDMEAIDNFDRAISLAHENGYIHEEAHANELSAKFWMGKGKDEFAKFYLKRSHYLYNNWGALQKVRHLEAKYPHFLIEGPYQLSEINSEPVSDDHPLFRRHSEVLDLVTMMKTSQAISGEIEFNKLLTAFTKIIIENAGAQKGYLILKYDGDLRVEAYGSVDHADVKVGRSIPLEKAEEIATSIVEYVAKTKEYLVLNNASHEGVFTNDHHVKSLRLKSVLCAPILHKSSLTGVLYLENNLISGAFTPERIEILKLLSSQIAISIENARLYGDLKKAEEKYRAIFENATEGIYQTAPQGRFISANPALAHMFGFSTPQELMDTITDIKHQLYVNPAARSDFITLMEEKKAVSGFEVEFYRKDRSRFWASLHARPVYDDKDNLLFIEGIVTDITEKKKSLETLLESEEYLRKENIRLRSTIKDRYKFGNIVGKSRKMQEVYELILRAAATDVSVIIYGESGTGKELVAKSIHEMSDRKDGLFVPVNSGAIPENLLESEFFGYKKGAFTGAITDKHGYLDLAKRGTLFMDELAEINLFTQVKLLRAIEGGGYMPVGGTDIKKSDARIIAATSRDLQDYVKKGLMREDFFYRIHIFPIYLPPLRERKEDIPLLIDHFMNIYQYKAKAPPITGKVLETFLCYDWPGNVRELENTLHRYVTLKKLDFLNPSLRESKEKRGNSRSNTSEEISDLGTVVANFEKQYIMNLLEQNQWHRTKVSAILGITRATLFNKMKAYGLNKKH